MTGPTRASLALRSLTRQPDEVHSVPRFTKQAQMNSQLDHATVCWLNTLSLEAIDRALRDGYAALRSRPYRVVAIKGLSCVEVSVWSGQNKQHQTFVAIKNFTHSARVQLGPTHG